MSDLELSVYYLKTNYERVLKCLYDLQNRGLISQIKSKANSRLKMYLGIFNIYDTEQL